MKRILLFGLLGGMLTAGSGCGLMQSIFYYRPCAMRGDCTSCDSGGAECDECNGPSWGPTRAPVLAPRRAVVREEYGRPVRGPACDSCEEPCHESCGHCWHRGPLSCFFALFFQGCWSGPCCGERYWGDFYSDPPDCWDPCDCYGNYNGAECRAGNCRQERRVSKHGGEYMDYGMSEGPGGAEGDTQIISETDGLASPSPSPTPAAKPHKAVKQ